MIWTRRTRCSGRLTFCPSSFHGYLQVCNTRRKIYQVTHPHNDPGCRGSAVAQQPDLSSSMSHSTIYNQYNLSDLHERETPTCTGAGQLHCPVGLGIVTCGQHLAAASGRLRAGLQGGRLFSKRIAWVSDGKMFKQRWPQAPLERSKIWQ